MNSVFVFFLNFFLKSFLLEHSLLLAQLPAILVEYLTLFKENVNVKEVFDRLVDIICERMAESLEAAGGPGGDAGQGTRLSQNHAGAQGGCSC